MGKYVVPSHTLLSTHTDYHWAKYNNNNQSITTAAQQIASFTAPLNAENVFLNKSVSTTLICIVFVYQLFVCVCCCCCCCCCCVCCRKKEQRYNPNDHDNRVPGPGAYFSPANDQVTNYIHLHGHNYIHILIHIYIHTYIYTTITRPLTPSTTVIYSLTAVLSKPHILFIPTHLYIYMCVYLCMCMCVV